MRSVIGDEILRQTPGLTRLPRLQQGLLIWLCMVMLCPFDLFAALQTPGTEEPDVYLDAELAVPVEEQNKPRNVVEADTTALNVVIDEDNPYLLHEKRVFNPDPNRAVWLSALFPGLGQIYNRRYWKLPIVVGGFMGLGYAAGWNNGQYQDYSQGYRDLLDNDPGSNSYMNFFPPNTSEDDLDKTWLTQVMKSRKDYYRRNRDLCIIFVVGLYLLCMVDAYVDASLAHFDISPDLSMDVQPAMWINPADRRPALGMNWAFTF